MQVELTEILAKYREELSDANHKVICYKLAIKNLETENEELKSKVTLLEGQIPDPTVTHKTGETISE